MFVKEVFDRLAALAGLLVLWPVLAVVAVLIRMKMPGGPVIFRQRRVGKDGRLFTMCKFRSMTLWNVLKGEMSLVGPRPDVPGYADCLRGKDREVLRLKPGITGPASLKYRNEEELLATVDDPKRYNDEVIFPDKVRINLSYLEHWSFWLDLKIIFYTIAGKDLEESWLK